MAVGVIVVLLRGPEDGAAEDRAVGGVTDAVVLVSVGEDDASAGRAGK